MTNPRRWIDCLSQDVRYAIRGLRSNPGFTATVVVVLGLGIGANTAMFSVVYGMLLHPLPYANAERIVHIGLARVEQPGPGPLYRRTFAVLQDEAESFAQVAAYAPRSLTWTGPEGPVILDGATVSSALFPLLGAALYRGRSFSELEVHVGANRVVVLSYAAWQRRFGSDPTIVGSALDLGGQPYTVVGVLAEGFAFPDPGVEFWIPLVLWSPDPSLNQLVSTFYVLGRLRAGVTVDRATAEVRAIVRRSGTASPERQVRVIPLREEMVAAYRPALLALSVAVAVILAIAGANVAGLLLARLITRQRELAMLGVLGASPGGVARRLMVEGVVLSLAAGAVGLTAAATILQISLALVPGTVPRLSAGAGDWAVLAFTTALSVGVGLFVGSVPALRWSSASLWRQLQHADAHGGGGGGSGLGTADGARGVLVVLQVALALVLLVGAGLLLRNFIALAATDPGYAAGDVLTARVEHPDLLSLHFGGITISEVSERHEGKRRFHIALAEQLRRLEQLAEVESVGLSSSVPFAATSARTTSFRFVGQAVPRDPAVARVNLVSPGYFGALRPHVRAGRVLTSQDRAGSPLVAVVNETLMRNAAMDVVGQHLVLMAGTRAASAVEVVGVVADVTAPGRGRANSRAEIYVSSLQPGYFSDPDEVFVSIRTGGDPAGVIPFLREVLMEVDPRAAPDDLMTMEARFSEIVAEPRFYASATGVFAGLAVFLAAFGVYSVVRYTVDGRRREFGIRLALGAQRRDILGLVLRRSSVLIGAGVTMGVLATAGVERVLSHAFLGAVSVDGPTVAAVSLVMAGVALVAAYLPVARAADVDPVETLRLD